MNENDITEEGALDWLLENQVGSAAEWEQESEDNAEAVREWLSDPRSGCGILIYSLDMA